MTAGKFAPAIEKFLSASSFAVVGASNNRNKFGYKCFACYLQNGRKVYPINPNNNGEILGHSVYAGLAELPEQVESVSIITPPVVTEQIVNQAIKYGVRNLWMQPGAESETAVALAQAAGINVIYGGPCLLVELGYLI